MLVAQIPAVQGGRGDTEIRPRRWWWWWWRGVSRKEEVVVELEITVFKRKDSGMSNLLRCFAVRELVVG